MDDSAAQRQSPLLSSTDLSHLAVSLNILQSVVTSYINQNLSLYLTS